MMRKNRVSAKGLSGNGSLEGSGRMSDMHKS